MDMRAAFRETIKLAEENGMPDSSTPGLGLTHLKDMYTRITPEFSESKLGRWLGWAQCAVVASDIGLTLEHMKELNQKWS